MRAIRITILLLLLAAAASPLSLIPLPDITGTGAVVQLSTNPIRAMYVQVIADSGNSAAARFACAGAGVVTSSNGLRIAAGGGYSTPVVPGEPYVLSSCYLYLANGDKAYVAYAN